jgi:hypothetical protein
VSAIKTGFGRRNTHCSNCGDERGGPFGHEISECRWKPGMTVTELTQQPHMAGREGEIWDTYVDRYLDAALAEQAGEGRG